MSVTHSRPRTTRQRMALVGGLTVNLWVAVVVMALSLGLMMGGLVYYSLDTVTTSNASAVHNDNSPRASLSVALSEDLGLAPEQFAAVSDTDGGSTPVLAPGQEIALTQPGKDMDGKVTLCSVGFYAQGVTTGDEYVVTAGHCADDVPRAGIIYESTSYPESTSFLYNDKHDMGMMPSPFPGQSYNTVRVGTVDDFAGSIDLTSVRQAKVGENVCALGRTSGWRCGAVTEVRGDRMTTSLCSYPGDSGGVVIAGNSVVGIITDSYSVDGINKCQRPGARSGHTMNSRTDTGSQIQSAGWILDHIESDSGEKVRFGESGINSKMRSVNAKVLSGVRSGR